MKNKAIFLDRDGVLNRVTVVDGVPQSAKSLSEFIMFDDVPDALDALKKMGFLLIVITNQPDVARGTIKKEAVEDIHHYLKKKFPIDAIYSCYHDNKDACDCRKPKSGLITDAAKYYNISLRSSFVIGDRWKDMLAGKNAQCRTIFLDAGYAETKKHTVVADCVVRSLKEAVEWISALTSE
ncbi:MAG: hypothetical protein A3F13_05010 [Gammaproteobacteria bacterium RIFCSPHIGHO2_12_FULL_40_19]|nr:MAG: hypothetical protein A3F13_05010 [Gammaproteobacteria bacterium RIFCSPHIGHO2_12_FULL_40_19]